jgi:stress-induced morphogen
MNSKTSIVQMIKDALKKHGIEISNCEFDKNAFDYYSGYISSNYFKGKNEKDRQTAVWDILKKELKKDTLQCISGILILTNEEYSRIIKTDKRETKHSKLTAACV